MDKLVKFWIFCTCHILTCGHLVRSVTLKPPEAFSGDISSTYSNLYPESTSGLSSPTASPTFYNETSVQTNDTATENINSTDHEQSSHKTSADSSDRCHILDEFGSWDFFYKYTKDEVNEVMCLCIGVCVDEIEPPAGFEEDVEVDNESIKDEDQLTFVLVTSCYSLIFGFGVIGNFLTICGLSIWMKKRSATFLLILGLACSDLFVLLICLPLKEMEFFRISNVFEGVVCKLVYYIKDFSLACSVLTLTVISFERFYAICYPLKAQFRCSMKRARILIVIIWIVSAILASPTIVAMKSYKSSWTNSNLCHSNFQDSVYTKLYYIYLLVILYVLPLLVMTYTYSRSCLTLWRSALNVQKMQGNNTTKKQKEASLDSESSGYVSSVQATMTKVSTGQCAKDSDNGEKSVEKRKRVLQLLLALLALFIVCWGPSLIIHVMVVMEFRVPHVYLVRLTTETMAFFNSCLNPYLYMAMSSQFRKTLRNKLSCTKEKTDNINVSISASKYVQSTTNISTVSSSDYQ